MKEYTFSEENAKKTIKSGTMQRIPLLLIAGAGGIYIANYQKGGRVVEDWRVLVLVICIMIPTLAYGISRGIKNGTKVLMKNRYTLTDTSIEHTTPGGKTVKIDLDKIELQKQLKTGLQLRSGKQNILIPVGLDEFEELSSAILSKLK